VLLDLVVSEPFTADGIGVVRLAGYLNGRDDGTIDAAIRRLVDLGCATAALDLTDVHPLCCRGLRSLLATLRRWRRRGVTLVLCGIRPSLRPIFDLLDLPFEVDLLSEGRRPSRFGAAAGSTYVNDDVPPSLANADP
jgi:anti-anti-sigma factor